ncbi:MAG: hypothetical protein GTO18_20230 [Anaerolineales bacterium]|nr:hypothetical protein [Anaerolineales bacterium]
MDKVLHKSIRIGCDTDLAFELFTDNNHLSSWFPVEADVEPVVGGKYELFWDPDDKENNSTIGCKVTAVEPGKLIAFEWKGPLEFKEFMNNADPLTHVVVLFFPSANGSDSYTDVHVIHSGWRSNSDWEKAVQFFDWAWDEELQELLEYVRKL